MSKEENVRTMKDVGQIKGKDFAEGGQLVFTEYRYPQKHTVFKVNIDLFTLQYLAEEMWKIINAKQKKIDTTKKALRGEQ